MDGLTLRPLAAPDCAVVAELHMDHLPTSFRGATGRRLLRRYYEAIARGDGACGYVACAGDRVAGYVCGVWDSRAVKAALLRRGGAGLVLWSALHATTRPGTLADLRRWLTHSAGDKGAHVYGYELRPVVVAPEYRGTGVAAALVEQIVADARRRGYPQVHLLAYGSDARALHFYRKVGFREIEPIVRDGVRFVCFVRETADAR